MRYRTKFSVDSPTTYGYGMDMYHTGQQVTWNTSDTRHQGTIRQTADGFYLTKTHDTWHAIRGRDLKEGHEELRPNPV